MAYACLLVCLRYYGEKKDSMQRICHGLQRYSSLPQKTLSIVRSQQITRLLISANCPVWVYKFRLGLFTCDIKLKIVVASTR